MVGHGWGVDSTGRDRTVYVVGRRSHSKTRWMVGTRVLPGSERVIPESDPVFVDESGRRQKLATFIGVGVGTGLLLSLVLVLASLFGASPVPLPGLPSEIGPNIQQVEQQPGAPTGPAAGASTGPAATSTPRLGSNGLPLATPTDKLHGPPSDRAHPTRTR